MEIKITRICEYCGVEFSVYRSEEKGKGRKRRFCTHEHSSLARMKFFDQTKFRFDTKNFHFFKSSPELGNYENVRKQDSFRKKYTFNEEFFKNGIHDEFTAYLYGIFLTDGSVQLYKKPSGKRYEQVNLKIGDLDVIEQVKTTLESNHLIHFYENDGTKIYRLSFNSSKLFNDLSSLGCGIHKTKTTEYPLINDSLDKHFIRGVVDGDGSWSKRAKRNDLTLKLFGTEKLLYGVYLKIKKQLDIVPGGLYYPIDHNSNYKMENFCVLTYGKINSIKIRNWLYKQSSIHCDRKYQIAWEF